MHPLRRLAALLAILLSAACASNPWVCTSDSCVSIATAPIPAEFRGSWTDDADTRLQVEFFRMQGGETVPNAALLVFLEEGLEPSPAELRTFDGEVCLVERRMGAAARSPRRFYRASLDADELVLEPLELDVLRTSDSPATIVQTEDGEALVYTDIRAMAATMVSLLADETAWGELHTFSRIQG